MTLSPIQRFHRSDGREGEVGSEARIFMNLPPGAINALWESFNDVADGFGIIMRNALIFRSSLS